MQGFYGVMHGLAIAATPMHMLYTLIGVFIGTMISHLPGIGPSAGIALLIPVTFGMDPTTALMMLIGIYYASLAAGNVRRLQAAARKVADGNFETTIPVASVGQLAPLARTFNEMQRRLAELDSARKQFIANASHELRTPIFSLGGFVELLEEEDDLSPAEREEFVRTMRGQIERLTKLTHDLLDLSQLDAGAMVMIPDGVDLGELAREAAREFGPRAEAHGSLLRLRTAERPVIALADRERVRQIIRILLDNALTHTPEGTEVSVTANSSSRRRAELIVSDQGQGIPQRVQGRIFERFYTGDSSGGSGLGLAIASELAQRMDGRITISSSRSDRLASIMSASVVAVSEITSSLCSRISTTFWPSHGS